MADTLFPQRQRCKTCRGNLGKRVTDPVLLGLYCSPRCAGMANPATDPGQAPRECVTMRDGRWQWKRRYRSESEIPDKIRQDPSTNWYWCGHCGAGHIGHSRIGEAEQFRMLEDWDDLGDFLTKRRGSATRGDVAKAAGVRPIRLRELEEGIRHEENLVTLLKVLPVLRTRFGVSMQQLRPSGGRR